MAPPSTQGLQSDTLESSLLNMPLTAVTYTHTHAHARARLNRLPGTSDSTLAITLVQDIIFLNYCKMFLCSREKKAINAISLLAISMHGKLPEFIGL